MLEKKEIIIGTIDEISDYLVELSKSCHNYPSYKYHDDNPMNKFMIKEEFVKQLNNILDKNKDGLGILFYMTRTEDPTDTLHEIVIKLEGIHVRIIKQKEIK